MLKLSLTNASRRAGGLTHAQAAEASPGVSRACAIAVFQFLAQNGLCVNLDAATETFPLQLPVPGRTGLDGLDEDEEEAAAAAAAASLDDPEDDDVDVGDEDGDDGEENMEADGAEEDGDDDLGHPLLQQHLHSGDNSLIDGAMEGVLDPADLDPDALAHHPQQPNQQLLQHYHPDVLVAAANFGGPALPLDVGNLDVGALDAALEVGALLPDMLMDIDALMLP